MDAFNVAVNADEFVTEVKQKWKDWTVAQKETASPGDELPSLLEEKQKLESTVFVLNQHLTRLQQFQKPLDEWHDTEKQDITMEESEELFQHVISINKENENSIEEKTLKPTVQAIGDFNRNLGHLLESIATLKEKHAKLFGANKEFCDVQHVRQLSASLQLAKEKMVSNQQVAQVEQEILEDRISRLKQFHLVAVEDLKAAEADVVETESKFSRMQKKAARLEHLSGIKCLVLGDLTLEITLVNDCLFDSGCDLTFIATLMFETDENDYLVLSQVDINQDIHLPSAAVKSATVDNDLPKLVGILKKVWLSESTLMSEISQLRQSHAIDWKPEERILHLMVGKCIVCRLTVPKNYPLSQSAVITLDQIVGSVSGVSAESVSLPSSSTLTQWVTHLETVLAGSP